MKIAVVSDIHDHIHNLRAVLERSPLYVNPGDVDRIEIEGVPA